MRGLLKSHWLSKNRNGRIGEVADFFFIWTVSLSNNDNCALQSVHSKQKANKEKILGTTKIFTCNDQFDIFLLSAINNVT